MGTAVDVASINATFIINLPYTVIAATSNTHSTINIVKPSAVIIRSSASEHRGVEITKEGGEKIGDIARQKSQWEHQLRWSEEETVLTPFK